MSGILPCSTILNFDGRKLKWLNQQMSKDYNRIDS